MKNIKHQLEIALVIKRISCKELARRLEITDTHIWAVARGTATSAPLRKALEEFIQEAKSLVPFEYPDQPLAA
ncbi:MAG: hypothetical protein WED82_02150 [Balneolales bacterium]